MNGNIYVIENLENGKKYVGSTVLGEERFRKHINSLNRGDHVNPHLQRAWNKYGENAFEFRMILSCKKEDVEELEQKYIDEYEVLDDDKGYNIFSDARHHEIPNQVRKKISDWQEENGNPFEGKTHTKESKKKQSMNANSRKNDPDLIREVKRQISETDKKFSEIADEFDLSQSMVSHLNIGDKWEHIGNYTYPIRDNARARALKGFKNPATGLTEEKVKKIVNLLMDTDLTQTEIAEKFDISRGPVRDINLGKNFEFDTLEYPLR